jgi:phosphoribosylaminoimidazolecarboxamide formyltransferase/IMP cyclohydrolase
LAAAPQLQGKELSYNNLVDLEAAWRLVQEFEQPATVIIKHTNPCGVATGPTQVDSYRRALEVDPVSAFGSVIAFNRPVTGSTAEEMSKLFVEAVVAAGFDPAALERLAGKKNLRLIDMSATAGDDFGFQFKAVGGGLLVQTPDVLPAQPHLWKCVTERQPTPEETEAMIFAWRVVKRTKSNAIVFARPGVLVGVGAGQMSRVDAVKLGATKARELKHPLEGTVLASDAFFPFSDGVEEAAGVGVTAVVQPGGSVRDNEVIAVANKHRMAMVLTGVRHFSH